MNPRHRQRQSFPPWLANIKAAHHAIRAQNSVSGIDLRNLRILVIWDTIIGLELSANYRIKQLAQLAKKGHIVTYVTARTAAPIRELGVPTLHLKTLRTLKVVPVVSFLLFQLFSIRQLVASLNRSDVIILEVRNVPMLFPFLMIRRLGSSSPALVLRVSTNPVETGGHLRTLGLHFVDTLSIKLASRFFERILFISPMMAQSYSARRRIPRNKTGVWPSAVDSTFFEPRLKARVDRLREEISPRNRVTVLYHGALSVGRGIMDTVRAFKILTDEHVPVMLVLLGRGPAKEEISRYVVSNELEEAVHLHGPVPYSDIPDYIAACDAGIVPLPDHPWWRNQCPLKLLEYLALSKPVIVSSIPSNTWVLGSAPVAVYLKGTTPQEIANGVRVFLSHRKQLKPNAGRQVAAEFSIEKIASLIEKEVITALRSPNVAGASSE